MYCFLNLFVYILEPHFIDKTVSKIIFITFILCVPETGSDESNDLEDLRTAAEKDLATNSLKRK